MELLRFLTCGSVDDGKSTLIGRLLYDSGAVQRDLLESIAASSKNGTPNLALLTDGLKSEREQGITIDVAYKYFSTKKRRFIIADTPGHVEYTRNMISGASTASLAVVLVDARSGVVEQTRRHSYIAAFMGIQHIVLCVNKMDLVDYSEDVFKKIKDSFLSLTANLKIRDPKVLPVAALHGDNVVHASQNMGWYSGPSLLELLESAPVEEEHETEAARMFVQTIIRPETPTHPDYRAYAGQIASGVFAAGDEIQVFPSGKESRITAIDHFEGSRAQAYAGDSISLRLADDIDISRGDLIVKKGEPPRIGREFEANLCWMSETPLHPRDRFLLRIGSCEVPAMLTAIQDKVDLDSLKHGPAPAEFQVNDIGRVSIKTARPLAFDSYLDERLHRRLTGAFILISESSNNTVAAGVI